MASDSSDEVESAFEYARSYYQNPEVLDDFERLARYTPATFANYIRLRRGIFEAPSSSLTHRERELLIVAMEIMARKTNPPPIGHALKALEVGATIEDLAEVISLCIMIGGMLTYQESGRYVLRAVEERVNGQ
jgi:alkylhydroperoxidase/carboxymuconolactone decarboxylase family protein YurZ